MRNYKKYNKATTGFIVPVLALVLIQVAENYGIKIEEGLAMAAVTALVGIVTSAFVYAVPNINE